MVAIVVLLLLLALFGGFGFTAHFLWLILVVLLVRRVARRLFGRPATTAGPAAP